jgi:cellulose synthase/poly-beta-1,6-N-acetylglucosamine synthase-like glycosyltransferase
MTPVAVLKTLYIAAALFLTLFTAAQGYLFFRYLLLMARGKHRSPVVPEPAEWPLVAVQLPIYNEKLVIGRLLDAVAALDYPRDRLIVQVLDDSTDDTVSVVSGLVAQHAAAGLDVRHVRRRKRTGYKAGAMAHGMKLIPRAEFIAIFDADFVPPSDFLRRTVPHLCADGKIAFVQTRWGHLNAGENWLTGAQALSFDGYYVMEQTVRARTGLLFTFNGTGGVWRTAAIQDAGGWSSDTLTEDFDLSFRAQIRGWRGQYLPEIAVPGEIPMQTETYKRQQMRWATGSTQTLLKLIGPVWRSSLSPFQKFMATINLMQYLPHPVMMLMMALAPLMLAMRGYRGLDFGPLATISLIAPVMTLFTQVLLGGNWPRRMVNYPFVMILGTGMMWNNTRAFWTAIQSWREHRELEFVRTPKFAHVAGGVAAAAAVRVKYTVHSSVHTYFELALSAYAVGIAVSASRYAPSIVPLFVLHATALAVIGGRALIER